MSDPMSFIVEGLNEDETASDSFKTSVISLAEKIHSADIQSPDVLLLDVVKHSMECASILSFARQRSSRAAHERDTIYYERKRTFRNELSSGSRVTEGRLDELVYTDPEFVAADLLSRQCKATEALLENMVYTIRDKHRSLMEISVNRRHDVNNESEDF